MHIYAFNNDVIAPLNWRIFETHVSSCVDKTTASIACVMYSREGRSRGKFILRAKAQYAPGEYIPLW